MTVTLPVDVSTEIFSPAVIEVTMPDKRVPLPTKFVAVTIPVKSAPPIAVRVAAIPVVSGLPILMPSLAVIRPTESTLDTSE